MHFFEKKKEKSTQNISPCPIENPISITLTQNKVFHTFYKGSAEGNFERAIKLLEYGFNLYKPILIKKLREIVDIDFMPGRGTGDTVFILRRLAGKYWSNCKKLFYKYVDLEKVVDRVPQKVA